MNDLTYPFFPRIIRRFAQLLVLSCTLSFPVYAQQAHKPIKVKVFIASMFEIGKNTGDKPGEFQNWYERYWMNSQPIPVKGAPNPVYCNQDDVCGAVLGMGKVRSSSAMQAILLNPQFDFSETYFILSGVGGTPPSKGTIGAVSWATWLVDYDLGHRWADNEGKSNAHNYMPRKGYEDIRVFKLNPALVDWAMQISQSVPLKDDAAAQRYRQRYSDQAAQRKPFLFVGTHIAGDCFFHGPGLSEEAQYIAKLNGADDYVITEMEGVALAHVIKQQGSLDRVMSLRGAVNFDQGNPNETTLAHLDPAPGQTAGGFVETTENITNVGGALVDYIVSHWSDWKNGVPRLKK